MEQGHYWIEIIFIIPNYNMDKKNLEFFVSIQQSICLNTPFQSKSASMNIFETLLHEIVFGISFNENVRP